MSPEFIAQLHPKIVHFPIALLLTYAFLETLGAVWRKEFISKAAGYITWFGRPKRSRCSLYRRPGVGNGEYCRRQ